MEGGGSDQDYIQRGGASSKESRKEAGNKMPHVAILAFYGLLVCGLGGGMAFFHQVGRIGLTQALHVMIPMSGVQFSGDDWKRLADITWLPTSFSDLFLSPTPAGWVKTFGSVLAPLSRYPGIAFVQAMISGLVGKIWYAVSLRLLALNIALGPALRYWPQWLTASRATPVNSVFYVMGDISVRMFWVRKSDPRHTLSMMFANPSRQCATRWATGSITGRAPIIIRALGSHYKKYSTNSTSCYPTNLTEIPAPTKLGNMQ
jgi:hypothetical protein